MSSPQESYELKELHKLEGHTDRVWCVAWKPITGGNGVPAVLASCSGDKTVRIWVENPDTGSFQCQAILDETHTRTVRSCAWSPRGDFLVTASFDGTTAVWENVGGDYRCVATLEGHENEVKCASWSPSGRLLATCGRDKTVWIWSMDYDDYSFECYGVMTEHTQDVKMVRWHTHWDILFSCSYDNTVKVWWNEGAGEDDWYCAQTLDEDDDDGHSSTVWALSFNKAGDKMVTCSDDLTLKIWDAPDYYRMDRGDGYADWELICTLSGFHDRAIFSVHWSSDGIIASGAADDAICLFAEDEDDECDEPKYPLLLKKDKAHDMDVNCVHWNSWGNGLLASASDDKTIKIWEMRTSPAGHGQPPP